MYRVAFPPLTPALEFQDMLEFETEDLEVDVGGVEAGYLEADCGVACFDARVAAGDRRGATVARLAVAAGVRIGVPNVRGVGPGIY